MRYADVYQGSQCVSLDITYLFGSQATKLTDFQCWPYAADNHYFNPDTGKGLQAGALNDAATWGPYILDIGFVGLDVAVDPHLDSEYPSALGWIETEFANAQSAFQGGSPLSIGGRTGLQLAMFYLGWASHFMQDQTVVHHTFDEPLKHHAEYEKWADGDASTNPPTWHGAFTAAPSPDGLRGMYNIPTQFCTVDSPACFGRYANSLVHSAWTLDSIDNEASNNNDQIGAIGTASIQGAIPIAERLQAGLFRYFFTAVGQTPIHMSAVIPSINVVLL